MDGTVRFHRIVGSHAIFNNEQRLVVTVVEGIQGKAQTKRVDLPAPFAGFEVRIDHAGHHSIASRVFCGDLWVCRSAAAGIVAETDEIHAAFLQHLFIFRFRLQSDPCALHPLLCPDRISAVRLHVNKEIIVPIPFHGQIYIFRCACVGIELTRCQHTSHHGSGHLLVRQFDCSGAGQQFVVCSLILDLLFVFAFFKHKTGPHKGHMQQHIDLVKGQPVMHDIPVTIKQHLTVAHKGIYHPAVFPAAVLFDQRNGRIKMADRDQRFDAIFTAFLEHAAVEGKTRFVGDSIISIGEDTGPRNGHPVAFEAHLCKQSDVLFIMVVQVNGFMGRVAVLCVAFQHLHLTSCDRSAVRAKGNNIHTGQSTAIHIVRTLALVCSGSSAPQKAFGHFHGCILTFCFICVSFPSCKSSIANPLPLEKTFHPFGKLRFRKSQTDLIFKTKRSVCQKFGLFFGQNAHFFFCV